ncbi:HAD family hydrolase [Clostridium bornimense]|uniref:HAD family hydrolase n=1 Tax=Clostridium bornimense TaxID=1216932 RepID=W6S1Q6_9CLOT|nr:HAD family phosphatase [Clostridium bornimense]CDM68227.1 HAD family hydrolase [Clostridium bornimense]
MKEVKAIIFDMDGVIFDTERVYLDIWSKVFEKYGYKITKEVYISVMGRGRKKVKEIFMKNFGENMPIEEMYMEKDAMLAKVIGNNEVPMKLGAYDLLKYLKENNYKVALATSARRNRVTKQIEAAEIESFFDAIVCGDDILESKPNPEIFIKAACNLEVDKEKCIVIEDSPAGIEAAYNANMIGIHVEDLKKADNDIKKYCYRSFKSLIEVGEFLKG